MMRTWRCALFGVTILGIAAVAGVRLHLFPRAARGDARGFAPRPQLSRVDLPQPAGPAEEYDFTWGAGVLEAAEGGLPAEVMVYGVVRQTPTRDIVCDLAARLGVIVSPEPRASLPYTTADGSPYMVTLGEVTGSSLGELDLSVFDSGNYRVSWRSRRPGQEDEALSEDATAAVAEGFVKDTGLLPEGCRLVEVVMAESTGWSSPDGTVHTRILSRQAVYGRFLEGIRDGSFAVEVNAAGQVRSILRRMRDISPVARFPILRPDEAFQALSSEQAMVSGPWHPGRRYQAVIESVNLEYWEGAAAWDLDTIQPLYRFEGKATVAGGTGSSEPFFALVPAVRPQYLAPVSLPMPGGTTTKPPAAPGGVQRKPTPKGAR